VNSAAPDSARLTLYHRHHARQQRGKSLSHLVPAVVLLSGVAGLLGNERLSWVLAAEIVVGAAYLILLVRELLHLRRHPHHHAAVAWLELAAAGILALEGYHIWHRHHEAQLAGAPARFHVLPWLYGLLAAFYVWLAFNVRRLGQRRYLHLHPEGFSGRLHPFGRRFEVRWAEGAELRPAGPAAVRLRYPDGRERELSFAALHEGAALQQRLLAHAAEGRRRNEEGRPAEQP
jgi:hypothetical protein